MEIELCIYFIEYDSAFFFPGTVDFVKYKHRNSL